MQITMQHAERLSLAQMRGFLSASSTLSFAGVGRKQIYGLLAGVLRVQKTPRLNKGIVRLNVVKISGLSVAQISRLIARWRERGVIQPRASQRPRFPHRYGRAGGDRRDKSGLEQRNSRLHSIPGPQSTLPL